MVPAFLTLVFRLCGFNPALVERDYDLSAAPVGFGGLKPNMQLIPGDIDRGGVGGKGIEAAHSQGSTLRTIIRMRSQFGNLVLIIVRREAGTKFQVK